MNNTITCTNCHKPFSTKEGLNECPECGVDVYVISKEKLKNVTFQGKPYPLPDSCKQCKLAACDLVERDGFPHCSTLS